MSKIIPKIPEPCQEPPKSFFSEKCARCGAPAAYANHFAAYCFECAVEIGRERFDSLSDDAVLEWAGFERVD